MQSDSIYRRYQERLNRLVDKQWPAEIIDIAVQRWPDWDNGVAW